MSHRTKYRRAAWVGVALAALLGWALAPAAHAAADAPRAPAPIVRAVVQQAITPATTRYLQAALALAQTQQAQALLIELDTPGGLLDATQDIVRLILNAPLPVIVYIAPEGARAASAGTLITLAAHVAAMAPGTHLGAAHPVSLFGGGDDKVMGEKIMNDTVAFVQSIAELRGRNVQWAISAVRESKSITANEALKLNVVDVLAEGVPDLLKQLEGRRIAMGKERTVTLHTEGAPLVPFDMSSTQSLLGWASNPNLVFLLLIVGLVGLYIELSHPGLIWPGVVGGTCLIAALAALQTLPIHYAALGLLFLGVVLLIAEAFVTTLGLLALAGLVCVFLGSWFLLDEARTDLQIDRTLIVSLVAGLGLLALWVARVLLKSLRAPSHSVQATLVGQRGEVREALGPGQPGRVQVLGESWKARADTPLAAGTAVLVTAMEGLTLTVQAAPGAAQAHTGSAQAPQAAAQPAAKP